eukprot:TRINITY_DN12862_c0_g1_i1.p1 TRINITY_DN12862_c0_g1~~TRINITY_DN12862_c0_g1_i1.p1  ORF type:complete len:150 (-),score=10.31 TRINITY_DN12862_c0_g1_i1:59-508(-)
MAQSGSFGRRVFDRLLHPRRASELPTAQQTEDRDVEPVSTFEEAVLNREPSTPSPDLYTLLKNRPDFQRHQVILLEDETVHVPEDEGILKLFSDINIVWHGPNSPYWETCHLPNEPEGRDKAAHCRHVYWVYGDVCHPLKPLDSCATWC